MVNVVNVFGLPGLLRNGSYCLDSLATYRLTPEKDSPHSPD